MGVVVGAAVVVAAVVVDAVVVAAVVVGAVISTVRSSPGEATTGALQHQIPAERSYKFQSRPPGALNTRCTFPDYPWSRWHCLS